MSCGDEAEGHPRPQRDPRPGIASVVAAGIEPVDRGAVRVQDTGLGTACGHKPGFSDSARFRIFGAALRSRRFLISAAKIVPNRFRQDLTVS